MKRAAAILLAALLMGPASVLPMPALAQGDGREAATERSERDDARARALGRQLRCVVCQNQSIEESDAELASDMRRLVREQIEDGATDAEVMLFMRERYGDFVLLRPPLQANTALLWLAPLLLGGGAVAWWLRGARAERAPAGPPVAALSPEERARLETLRERAP